MENEGNRIDSSHAEFSREDLTNLIESLIDDHEIRDIITESLFSLYDDSESISKGIHGKKEN